ncbi:MAG TPA: N-6 DNA methylase, partial [Franconibacter pulveris]|nr:N-6 DNA methylase [Franconibacter pulveris]
MSQLLIFYALRDAAAIPTSTGIAAVCPRLVTGHVPWQPSVSGLRI